MSLVCECLSCSMYDVSLLDSTSALMSGPPLVPVAIPEDPEEHERIHVHEVYDEIDSHFSSTRYKVRLSPLLVVSLKRIGSPGLLSRDS